MPDAANLVQPPPSTAPASGAHASMHWQEADGDPISSSHREDAPGALVPASLRGVQFLTDPGWLDPIDGAAIRAGEPASTCACGLLYRHASVLWLAEHLAGQCVGCGAALPAPAPAFCPGPSTGVSDVRN